MRGDAPGLKSDLQITVRSSCTLSTCPSLHFRLKIRNERVSSTVRLRNIRPWKANRHAADVVAPVGMHACACACAHACTIRMRHVHAYACGHAPSKCEPIAIAGSAHATGVSSCTTAHISAESASRASRHSYLYVCMHVDVHVHGRVCGRVRACAYAHMSADVRAWVECVECVGGVYE